MTDQSGKLVAVIGDEDTVTGFLLAGVGHRNSEDSNFLVVKSGKTCSTQHKKIAITINDFFLLSHLKIAMMTNLHRYRGFYNSANI